MALDPIAVAIPAFFGLIGLELLASRLRGVEVYRFADAITDLSCGISSQVTGVFAKLAIFLPYLWLYDHRLLTLEGVTGHVVAFLGVNYLATRAPQMLWSYALITLATLPQDTAALSAVVTWSTLDLVDRVARVSLALVSLLKIVILVGFFLMHTRVRFKLQFFERGVESGRQVEDLAGACTDGLRRERIGSLGVDEEELSAECPGVAGDGAQIWRIGDAVGHHRGQFPIVGRRTAPALQARW